MHYAKDAIKGSKLREAAIWRQVRAASLYRAEDGPVRPARRETALNWSFNSITAGEDAPRRRALTSSPAVMLSPEPRKVTQDEHRAAAPPDHAAPGRPTTPASSRCRRLGRRVGERGRLAYSPACTVARTCKQRACARARARVARAAARAAVALLKEKRPPVAHTPLAGAPSRSWIETEFLIHHAEHGPISCQGRARS